MTDGWRDVYKKYSDLTPDDIEDLKLECWKAGILQETVDKADRLDLVKCILFWIETEEIWRKKALDEVAYSAKLREALEELAKPHGDRIIATVAIARLALTIPRPGETKAKYEPEGDE